MNCSLRTVRSISDVFAQKLLLLCYQQLVHGLSSAAIELWITLEFAKHSKSLSHTGLLPHELLCFFLA